jgi:hypothetical protein
VRVWGAKDQRGWQSIFVAFREHKD